VAVNSAPTLVVLRALGLGDLLTAMPALYALCRAFPEHRRVLAAPKALAPLALHTGVVHAVEDTEPLAALSPALHGADVAVNLHGKGPESHAILRATRPRRLIAFGENGADWRADEHEVERWCRLLRENGIPAYEAELDIDAPRLAVPREAHGATLIHPGAASAARRWPLERFAAVARAERAAGRRVVVTGGRAEVDDAGKIAGLAGSDGIRVYAGRTDVLELASLVAAAGRVVCGDTGVGHLATALGIPSVLLFGPTSPAHWGPPAERAQHRVLWSGGTGDPHGTTPDSGLLEIGVPDVLRALDDVSSEPAVRSA
jgi:ADP-heptose:LPS heptosyltransferase